MWRIRFQHLTHENWLWSSQAAANARQAQDLAREILADPDRHTVVDETGNHVSAACINAARDYYLVPAQDVGYVPALAR